MSAGRVLASVFWDFCGIVFFDYVERGITINNKYYIALLVQLKEEIAKKRPQIKRKKVLFQDNAPCYKSMTTMAKLHELHFDLLPRPPYSPDLAPNSYYLRVCRPKKNASVKEIWLNWKSDCRHWSLFWSQKQIVLQKRHCNIRRVLEQ